jgi:peptidoglycan/xylan/chitin deacetylase (PgdA/CDA1 family)
MYNPFSITGWQAVARRQPPGCSDVALTFDDGPSPETTPTILTLLRRSGATATFFLSGERMERHLDLVQALVRDGHAVFPHGWAHISYSTAGLHEAINANLRAEALLATLRPTPLTYWVRLPYNQGFRDARLHGALRRLLPASQFLWWSHSTMDYSIAETCRTEAEVAFACSAVISALERDPSLPGAVVLLHEAPFGVPTQFVGLVCRTIVDGVLQVITRRGLRAGSMRFLPKQPWWKRHLLLPAKPKGLWCPNKTR